ncbi:hypothetical protein [Neosynechococcus sphagnicola]|uniref:hypothetical protein n=1 Tax=Neosynechococcus sphagnicola TaxID=1501145 RepID=UPI001EF9F127|nr:hypothetical protein [Neosynechococcus sphagnicola]
MVVTCNHPHCQTTSPPTSEEGSQEYSAYKGQLDRDALQQHREGYLSQLNDPHNG